MTGLLYSVFWVMILDITFGTRQYPKHPPNGLHAELLSGYDKSSLPVKNINSRVDVKVRLFLNQVLGVDDKSETMTSDIWLLTMWTDEYMVWNTTRESGSDYVVLTSEDIWTPDLEIRNTVGASKLTSDVMSGSTAQRLLVFNDGTVKLWQSVSLVTSCNINTSHFPFDTQSCDIVLVSWTWDTSKMTLSTLDPPTVRTRTMSNSVMRISDLHSYVRANNTYCCPTMTYDIIVFQVDLERKSQLYVINLVLPAAMLAIIATCSFVLPPGCGERVSLGLTAFLAFSVFSLVIAEKVPESAENIPFLTVVLFQFMLCTLGATIWSVVVIRVYDQSENYSKLNPRLLKIIKRVAKCILNSKMRKKTCQKLCDMDTTTKLIGNGNGCQEEAHDNHRSNAKSTEDNILRENMTRVNKDGGVSQVYIAREDVSPLADPTPRLTNDGEDWKLLMDVCDRLIFYAYVLLISVTMVIVAVKAASF